MILKFYVVNSYNMESIYDFVLSCTEIELYDGFHRETIDLEFIEINKLEKELEDNKNENVCLLYKIGFLYLEINNDNDKAKEYFQRCIELNSSWGYLGMYLIIKIRDLFDKAVELNNPIALQFMACRSVEIENSMNYFEKAADLGDYESMIQYFNNCDSKYFNPEKALKYRNILYKKNRPKSYLNMKDIKCDKYLQIVEAKLFKAEDENKLLKNHIDSLKLELSLIPGYGEIYKQSEKDFEEYRKQLL